MHCHFTRTAFTVDSQPRNGDRPASAEYRRAGNIGGLFADLRDIAEDHVIDQRRRQIDPLQQTV
ncbi:hypothetical protein D3C73_1284970 [compost metagenome]